MKGMSDTELKNLCRPAQRSRFSLPPRLYPLAELYGLGTSIRKVTGWPTVLPIPFMTDHGVTFLEHLTPGEVANSAKLHFTWSRARAGVYLKDRKIKRIMNPSVMFRRARGIFRRPEAKGTIVFVDHSYPTGDVYSGFDWAKYARELRALPEEMLPVVLCLHSHDISWSLHEELRTHGFDLVTVGNPEHPEFMRRFYALVTRFRFASSANPGTAIFLSEEAGVRAFLLGERNSLESAIRDRIEFEGHNVAEVDNEFRRMPPQRSYKRDQLLTDHLGLDVSFLDSVSALRRALVTQTPYAFMRAIRNEVSQLTKPLVRG